MKPTERRMHERFPSDTEVAFRRNGKWCNGRIADISESGMLILDALPEAVGDILFFRVASETTGVAYHIEGRVVWKRAKSRIRQRRNKKPDSFGVEFLSSPVVSKDLLRSVVANISPSS